MNSFKRVLLLISLVAPAAIGANLELTGPGSNGVLAGVYIGPYEALIDGVPTPVICDDFSSETTVGETWTANTFTFADLSNPTNLAQTRWGREGFSLSDYQQAAWLSLQLASYPSISFDCGPTDQCAGDIQYAIWSKFDPNATTHLANYAPNHLPFVQTWLNRAASEYTNYDYSNFLVYTPTSRVDAPQEFIVVKTPEPSEASLLCVELSAVAGLLLFVRRRQKAPLLNE